MQLMSLSGVRPDTPVDWQAPLLQEGKRFSSRHVRGSQGERLVADAHISFEVPSTGLHHESKIYPIKIDPMAALPLSKLPLEWEALVKRVSGYSFMEKDCLEFRIPDPQQQLFGFDGNHRLEFWLRARHPIPDSPHWRAIVLAYLSDWWLNYSSLGGHLGSLEQDTSLYGASLNHALWLYGDCNPSEWMLVVSESPRTGGGRGLSVAKIIIKH